MGRLRDVLAWELGDHVRLIVFALSVSGLTLVLTAKVLETRVSAVPSGTGRFLGPNLLTHAILSPLGDPSPWTMLSLLIPIFAILTFRYERDMGYAQSLYTLPLSKGRIFLVKTAVVLLLSLLTAYVPILIAIAGTHADIWPALREAMSEGIFISAMVLTLYFVLYAASVSILVSLLFRNAFLDFMASFFLLAVPKFVGVNAPPFSFSDAIRKLPVTYFRPYEPLKANFFEGMILPVLLLLAAFVLMDRRDVL